MKNKSELEHWLEALNSFPLRVLKTEVSDNFIKARVRPYFPSDVFSHILGMIKEIAVYQNGGWWYIPLNKGDKLQEIDGMIYHSTLNDEQKAIADLVRKEAENE